MAMLMIRRVTGGSMRPALRHGQIVVAIRRRKNLQIGDVVVFRHDNLEKIKRITRLDIDKLYVEGDNKTQSTDSRRFGWIDITSVLGKVILPRKIRVISKSPK